jgi:hypothetical protein
MPEGDKQSWTFDRNLQIDMRSPRALEFIAHYLDRIEGHLAHIVEAIDQGKLKG